MFSFTNKLVLITVTICQTSDIYLKFQKKTINFISSAITKSLDMSYLYLVKQLFEMQILKENTGTSTQEVKYILIFYTKWL